VNASTPSLTITGSLTISASHHCRPANRQCHWTKKSEARHANKHVNAIRLIRVHSWLILVQTLLL